MREKFCFSSGQNALQAREFCTTKTGTTLLHSFRRLTIRLVAANVDNSKIKNAILWSDIWPPTIIFYQWRGQSIKVGQGIHFGLSCTLSTFSVALCCWPVATSWSVQAWTQEDKKILQWTLSAQVCYEFVSSL